MPKKRPPTPEEVRTWKLAWAQADLAEAIERGNQLRRAGESDAAKDYDTLAAFARGQITRSGDMQEAV